MSRLYVVSRHGEAARLIRANSQAQAIGFVTRDLFSAEAADPEDVVAMMTRGIHVEDATNKPDAGEGQQS